VVGCAGFPRLDPEFRSSEFCPELCGFVENRWFICALSYFS
jgi:hypothetical protein